MNKSKVVSISRKNFICMVSSLFSLLGYIIILNIPDKNVIDEIFWIVCTAMTSVTWCFVVDTVNKRSINKNILDYAKEWMISGIIVAIFLNFEQPFKEIALASFLICSLVLSLVSLMYLELTKMNKIELLKKFEAHLIIYFISSTTIGTTLSLASFIKIPDDEIMLSMIGFDRLSIGSEFAASLIGYVIGLAITYIRWVECNEVEELPLE